MISNQTSVERKTTETTERTGVNEGPRDGRTAERAILSHERGGNGEGGAILAPPSLFVEAINRHCHSFAGQLRVRGDDKGRRRSLAIALKIEVEWNGDLCRGMIRSGAGRCGMCWKKKRDLGEARKYKAAWGLGGEKAAQSGAKDPRKRRPFYRNRLLRNNVRAGERAAVYRGRV
jgi:hypothetical protein